MSGALPEVIPLGGEKDVAFACPFEAHWLALTKRRTEISHDPALESERLRQLKGLEAARTKEFRYQVGSGSPKPVQSLPGIANESGG